MTTKKSRTIGVLTVCIAVAASIGTASADWVTATVSAGTYPYGVAVNPVTNRIYVANNYSSNVTVIDGATDSTTTVPADSAPWAVAVNPVTNKIYVTNEGSNNVTVINGVTNDTTLVPAGWLPTAVTVNPVTNRIYVANWAGNNVTVIDGATDSTTTVPAGSYPQAGAVNPVTNKIYVANNSSDNVTVIDGATNGTTLVPVGDGPRGVTVNPVTNKVYVANGSSNSVTVVTDAPGHDTRVRAAFDRLTGDTTALALPALTGKGVNRSAPGRTAMMGVFNRMNTTQKAWDWATTTSGAGTDSIMWSYTWGEDSLILGENFVCCVPLEDQAATTNNLGFGSPFAGNLEVYPVYRVEYHVGIEESPKPQAASSKLLPTMIRGVLFLGDCPRTGTVPRALLDISGRKALDLAPGANDVRRLAPGVYFVREGRCGKTQKVVIVE